jgi:molecular chaperone GrpE
MDTADETNKTPAAGASGDAPASSASDASAPASSSGAPASAEAPAKDPLVAERDQLREQLLRTAADFDNYRKRARREMDEAKMRGKDDAIKEILPVFDNLERAVAASDNAQSVASVVEGVKMVLKLFQDTSERMGLNRVPTIGQRFDPAMHEAIQQKETDEAPPGTIITEVVPGYMFGQRLLRAAMVVVARKPAAAASADAAGHGEPASASAPNPSVKPPNSGGPDSGGTDKGNGENSA